MGSHPKMPTAPASYVLANRMGGDVPHAVTATIGEMTEEGAVSSIIGCACSSNQPGGGAIANAEVSGVPLASIAAKVGIR